MLIINKRLDADETRWIDVKSVAGLKLKVGSIDSHGFKSRQAIVRRHIDRLDASFNVGTEQFDLDKVGNIDSLDDLLLEPCVKYLLLDWQGVGEIVDGKEVAIQYTPEHGLDLLRQKPELYWEILKTGSDIAQGVKEQQEEAVGKP
ncbi:hypothetical protein [Rosenbergiella epipactidis]|uniref:hypothetical protein n=1 Tax=Rosenbergiella epipactidis TaxID=1544694 RepID=UPI001F5012DC|nr:hypothetical protein [Rosenbergiella epipactidis]